MSGASVTTPEGTTITLREEDGNTIVVLDNPAAPRDMQGIHAGRIVDGGYQSPIFMPFAMRPSVLRAIADLMESGASA